MDSEKSGSVWNSDDIETIIWEGKVDSKKRKMAYLEEEIGDWMSHPETPHPIFREKSKDLKFLKNTAVRNNFSEIKASSADNADSRDSLKPLTSGQKRKEVEPKVPHQIFCDAMAGMKKLRLARGVNSELQIRAMRHFQHNLYNAFGFAKLDEDGMQAFLRNL